MPRVSSFPTVAVQRRKRLRKEMIRRLTLSGKLGDHPSPWCWKHGQLVDAQGTVLYGTASGHDPVAELKMVPEVAQKPPRTTGVGSSWTSRWPIF